MLNEQYRYDTAAKYSRQSPPAAAQADYDDGNDDDFYVDLSQRRQVEHALDFLTQHKDNMDRLFGDDETYLALNCIYAITSQRNDADEFLEWDVMVEKNADQIFGAILAFLYERRQRFEFSLIEKTVYKNLDISKLELTKRYTCVLFVLLRIMYQVSCKAVEFNLRLCANGSLERLVGFLNDNEFLAKLTTSHNYDLIDSIVGVLNWLSKSSDYYKQTWLTKLDSVSVLLKIAKHYPSTCLLAQSTVINILTDAKIESSSSSFSSELGAIVDRYLVELEKCARSFEINDFNRHRVDLIDGFRVKHNEAHYIRKPKSRETVNCSILTLLAGLHQLAINDRMRENIHTKLTSHNSLRPLLAKGNDIERIHAVKLLFQLCFNEQVSGEVKGSEQRDVMNLLKDLSQDEPHDNDSKALTKLAQNLLKWLGVVEGVHNSNKPPAVPKQAPTAGDNSYVYICHDQHDRATCQQLKSKLESSNFKVWLSTSHDLHTNMDAIEASKQVILYINEKFRQNVYCQAEANYAKKLSKPIVPLLSQAEAETSKYGWIAKVLANNANVKQAIQFNTHKFDESSKKLNDVLSNKTTTDNNNNSNSKASASGGGKPSSAGARNPDVRKWTEEDVKKWMNENRIDPSIAQSLSPCDGEFLDQLYKLKCEAPEFFFQSIQANNKNIGFKPLVQFSSKLRALFEKK